MLAPYIPNHVAQALADLLQQYKGKPRIVGILTALVQQIQDLEDGIYPLNDGRQLANAVGVQLDGIGEIVGLKRNGLDDDTYRIFIIGTIAKNFSDGTIPVIRTILILLFDAQYLLIFETYPAEIQVQFADSTRDPSLFPLISNLVQQALGAGIKLGSVTEFDVDNPFRFLMLPGQMGPQGGGFGDANDPSVGGKFGGVIYVNTGS